MLHPTFTAISAYADDDLPPRRRGRIAAHLRQCVGCRGILRDVRALATGARAVEPPPLPASTLARLLARRAGGERVILPLSDPAPPRRHRVPVGPIAAGIAAVAASIAILQARPPDGELRISPVGPAAGGRVSVDFQSAPGVSHLERVFLRARFRTARDTVVGPDVPETTVAELRREDYGRFTGTFTLPDSIVYAILVIEDGRGRRFDGPGLGWELLVHARGAVRYDAYVQQQRHRMPNVSTAIESARRAVAQFPHRMDARLRLERLERMAATQREVELAAQADRLPLLSR